MYNKVAQRVAAGAAFGYVSTEQAGAYSQLGSKARKLFFLRRNELLHRLDVSNPHLYGSHPFLLRI